MTTLDDLLPMWPWQLATVLASGHPHDITRLDDREYCGVSLGQPRFIEWLTWKKFKKVFHRDPDTGHLRGWNVRCHQSPLDQPWEDRFVGEERETWGHYRVVPAAGYRTRYDQALMIDYGLGGNARFDPSQRVRDPLVAVNAGDDSLLLGYSYVDLGMVRFGTPTFFALIRGGPLEYTVKPPLP